MLKMWTEGPLARPSDPDIKSTMTEMGRYLGQPWKRDEAGEAERVAREAVATMLEMRGERRGVGLSLQWVMSAHFNPEYRDLPGNSIAAILEHFRMGEISASAVEQEAAWLRPLVAELRRAGLHRSIDVLYANVENPINTWGANAGSGVEAVIKAIFADDAAWRRLPLVVRDACGGSDRSERDWRRLIRMHPSGVRFDARAAAVFNGYVQDLLTRGVRAVLRTAGIWADRIVTSFTVRPRRKMAGSVTGLVDFNGHEQMQRELVDGRTCNWQCYAHPGGRHHGLVGVDGRVVDADRAAMIDDLERMAVHTGHAWTLSELLRPSGTLRMIPNVRTEVMRAGVGGQEAERRRRLRYSVSEDLIIGGALIGVQEAIVFNDDSHIDWSAADVLPGERVMASIQAEAEMARAVIAAREAVIHHRGKAGRWPLNMALGGNIGLLRDEARLVGQSAEGVGVDDPMRAVRVRIERGGPVRMHLMGTVEMRDGDGGVEA